MTQHQVMQRMDRQFGVFCLENRSLNRILLMTLKHFNICMFSLNRKQLVMELLYDQKKAPTSRQMNQRKVPPPLGKQNVILWHRIWQRKYGHISVHSCPLCHSFLCKDQSTLCSGRSSMVQEMRPVGEKKVSLTPLRFLAEPVNQIYKDNSTGETHVILLI